MELPRGSYSKRKFVDFLLEHGEEVAPPDPRHRWLKAYSVLSGGVAWRQSLFAHEDVTELGEITEVKIHPGRDKKDERDENYYVMEHSPGLLLFFTTAIKEHYEKTLGDRLRKIRGITQLWSSPVVFDRQWRFLLHQTRGFVYRFMSRRSSMSDATAQLRPNYRRRFNYTGDDALEVLEELRETYGVLPQSLYARVSADLNIHLTNDGLFSAKIMSPHAFELFFGMIDLIRDEVLGLKETSQGLTFRVETYPANHIGASKVALIRAGMIRLPNAALDENTLRQLKTEIHRRGQFSVVDEQTIQGSLGFSATVVDERKGSVFNVSASEDQILLVPKYNTTFESFISFYRTVSEVTDSKASFVTYR